MKAPEFPVKAIVKIIVEETRSYMADIKKESYIMDEFDNMVKLHIKNIEKLDSYDAIDDWLHNNRRISLADWVESL